MKDPGFFSQTPEQSLANLRPDSTSMDLTFGSNFKIHGGQRAHKIKPRDNIGLDFLGQDDQKLGNKVTRSGATTIVFTFNCF